jgi:hypothetical protein
LSPKEFITSLTPQTKSKKNKTKIKQIKGTKDMNLKNKRKVVV